VVRPSSTTWMRRKDFGRRPEVQERERSAFPSVLRQQETRLTDLRLVAPLPLFLLLFLPLLRRLLLFAYPFSTSESDEKSSEDSLLARDLRAIDGGEGGEREEV
jgi:hypothetical protein